VKPRARRMAAVVASVPEEQKRILRIQGMRSRTSSPMRISRGLGAPKEAPSRRASCTACITAEWQWPRMSGPHEPT
jgi:hypothetical protein